MSWFFGKKKHQRDSPPSSPEPENPGQGDGFIFVERRGNEVPEAPQGGEGLYPNIGNVPQYPPMPAVPKQTVSVDPIQNILNDLPFKLCKQLVSNVNDDIEIDRHRVNEILSYILRLENEEILYDFSVEKNVINEMNSAGATL